MNRFALHSKPIPTFPLFAAPVARAEVGLLASLTQGWVSGHSLKHVFAAMAAWPVMALMHNGAHARIGQHGAVRA